ncbi:MAG: hypothetical protein MI919_28210 [Holophagales bacterium]|nr:hypothetical protein [Holophagales bacterium]
MPVELATWLVNLFLAYAAFGIVFALVFVWKGVGRIDPVAREGTWGFRLLILPGCAALWPLLLRRWVAGPGTPPDEDNPHRRAAGSGGEP